MRIGGIIEASLTESDGIGRVIFFQGCKRRCRGCHNPEMQGFDGGKEVTEEEAIGLHQKQVNYDELVFAADWIDDIVLCGGEPVDQPEAMMKVAKLAKEMGKNVWVYTGYNFDDLQVSNPELFENVDVVVDGEYMAELKQDGVRHRVTSNQNLWRKIKGKWVLSDD